MYSGHRIFKTLTLAFLISQILLLLYLLAHQSEGANLLLGRYSTRYALAIGVQGCFLIAATIATLQQARLARWLQRWALHGRLLLLAATGCGICAVWLLPMEDRLQQAAAVTGLGLALLICAQTSEAISQRATRRLLLLPGVVALVILALLLFNALTRFPFSPDEAHWADYASTFAQRGGIYARTWIAEPTPIVPGIGWSVAAYGWLLEQVAFDIRVGRVWNFVGYCVMLVGLWALARRLYGSIAAWFSVLLAIGSGVFFPVHDYRPHHQMAAASVWIAFLVISAHIAPRIRRQGLYAAFAGLVATLAMQLHAVAIVLVVGTSLYYAGLFAILMIRQRCASTAALGFAAGAFIGTILYFLLNIQPVGGLSAYFTELVASRTVRLRDFFFPLTFPTLLESLIVYAGVGFVLWRRSHRDLLYLPWLALVVISALILDSQGYRTVLAPLLIVLASALLAHNLDLQQFALPLRHLALALLAILCLLTSPLVNIQWRTLSDWLQTGALPYYAYSELTPRLAPLVSENDVIVSTHLLIWTLPHQPQLYSIAGEVTALNRWQLSAPELVWERLQPTVVIDLPQQMTVTDGLRAYMVAQGFALCESVSAGELTANVYRRVCG
ncbi:MAG: hypothetical protein SF123_24275 [Chloroflexota bacterium]|nr:hypothetical protein [Chloroflexota bacterium]